jgi:hypothetical protein
MGAYAGPDISESGLVLALDASNKKSYSQNEFQYSTDIFTALPTALRATLSRDAISSPVGNTPLKMVTTGNDPYTQSTSFIPATVGETWVVSVYVKANVSTTCQLFIFNANTSGVAFVNGSWVGISASTFNVTTEWQRISWYLTSTDATTGYVFCRLDGPDTYVAGTTLWWDGLQVERVPSGTTTPTPFTSAYYGGSVFKDLVGSNNGTLVNRTTYSGSNGGSLVFDGVDDYVAPTGLNDTFWQGNWTASFWVNFDTLNTVNTGASDKTLLQHGTPVTRQGLHLTQRNNCIRFGLYGDDLQATTILSTGRWYNVVFTLNNTTFVKQNYLNGVIDNFHTGSGAYIGTGNNARIGGVALTFGLTFDGFMSNCSFYNRVLTSTEIQQNYNATKSRFGL